MQRNSANKVVSSDTEELILVDDDDRELGHLNKALCHDGDGVLHRAFSLFIFDASGRLLMQQRSRGKRLWPLYWSNSCCSHPRKGESLQQATARRLMEELNIEANIEFAFKFRYQARYGDLGSEHELCSVLLGRSDQPVVANEHEIAAVRYMDADEIDRMLAQQDGQLTPWFKMEWERLRRDFASLLGSYLQPVN